MAAAPAINVAFVSTNSITQGEQVYMLWPDLLSRGIHINFAHRTFQWNNEAKGKAAVHCVIIGFSLRDKQPKWLFEYEHIKGDPHAIQVKQINPYLVDASDLIIPARSVPLCMVPEMINGSKPTDGGNLLLDDNERDELLEQEPQIAPYIWPFSMGDEYINGISRFCLWLKDCPPNKLKAMPIVLKRIEAVKNMRLSSSDAQTRKDAITPSLFQKNRQPNTSYLALPRVSSERRFYIPIGFLPAEHIAGDKLQTIPNAGLYHFGVITSLMHMAWTRTTTGRLKSDYQYSANIVYNNFPWPENPTEKQKAEIEKCAQAVLDARLQFPDSSLADLYDPLTMPPVLLKAHQALDKVVDAAYGKTNFKTEAERVAFLFELYQKYTSLLPVEKKKGKKK